MSSNNSITWLSLSGLFFKIYLIGANLFILSNNCLSKFKSSIIVFWPDFNISIVEINYREEYDLYAEYKLTGTPAVMLFREKELLNTWMGYKSHGQWKYAVDEELNPKEKVDPRLTWKILNMKGIISFLPWF